jgi:hypothetical protein
MSGCYLVEIVAAIDAAGTTTTLRYGTHGYNTAAGDTPASTHYEPRIRQPGLVRRDMFGSGRTHGATSVGYGEVRMVNADGGLDALLPYGFDGRALTLRFGDSDAAYSTFVTVLSATMEQADLTESEFSVRLKDKLYVLQNPLATALYGGTNALPAGVDGTADDIKGKVKPRLYGTVFNESPVQVNTARLIWQINTAAVQTFAAVYDQGVALTKGADYASQADMETTAPAAGSWRAWPAGGMFRLGSSPVGQITFDASQGAAASDRTAAQVLKQIALDMGMPSGDISAADVTALDGANGAELGVYVTDSTPALAIMDRVAASVGAWFGFDRLGVLRMGRLIAPAGTAVADIGTSNVIDLQRVTARDATAGLPVWRVTLGYKPIGVVQDKDLAGGVTDARRALLKEQCRHTSDDDAAIKTQYLTAPTLERDTLLIDAAATAAEASRLLTLFKARRDTYTCAVRLEPALLTALDLGAVVSLTYPRFNLAAGKLFIVLGLEVDLARNRANLTLWG